MSLNHVRRLRVVVPVFNDWTSFSILLKALDAIAASTSCNLSISAVDDGSTEEWSTAAETAASLQSIQFLEVIQLGVNVGHQRAIAIGLCAACSDDNSDAVLIMDSDGEDPPSAIPSLLEIAGDRKDFCVVAARRKRSEGTVFKTGYFVYKTLFLLVTGKKITFGNYSLLSSGYARRLTMVADLWNNLPAAILRSRLPIRICKVDRGTRYAGKSKMNFSSLIVHGFSAISVYADTIFVRLLLTGLTVMGLSIIAIVTTVLLRIFMPGLASPGWATTVSFGMAIIVLQVIFTALTSLLILLNSRIQRLVLPAKDYAPYIQERHVLLQRRTS